MDSDEFTVTQDTIFMPERTGHLSIPRVLPFYKKIAAAFVGFFKWVRGVSLSAIILAVLFFIVINFYIFSSAVDLNSFFYGFILLSFLTDGLYVLIHLPRKNVKHQNLSFDPAKLTIVIASYNGEKVIANTIAQAAKHVPPSQIVVVSDASTDNTAQVARQTGARVIVNPKNMHKAFSVSIAMQAVKTPYVLLLDDDTSIGDTFIPTSLLDEGYDAVAFNVLPAKKSTLINELQQFEYRQSMQLGKSLRGAASAVGNVSGAIGLFKTKDLIAQVTRHSGQFAGEDEQRTALVHLLGKGKGVTYTDAKVITEPPSSYTELYRQRAYKWTPAMPEMFTLYWRILLSPRYHYLLKAEKAYQLYYFFTDPLRLLFFWMLAVRSSHLLILYGFYLVLNTVIWVKLRFKASLRAVILYPFYSLFLVICRFIGHFYWLYIKAQFVSKKMYVYIQHRRILTEYALIIAVMIFIWGISGMHFTRDVSLLNKIKAHSLNDISSTFNYDNAPSPVMSGLQPAPAPAEADYLSIPVEVGDTNRAIAYKAIMEYLTQQNDVAGLNAQHEQAYTYLTNQIQPLSSSVPGLSVHVSKGLVQQALAYERGGNH